MRRRVKVARRLTYQDLSRLESGQKVRYIAGFNDYFVEATATVVRVSGKGAIIRLEQIHSKGRAIKYQEGGEIIAGPHELELA